MYHSQPGYFKCNANFVTPITTISNNTQPDTPSTFRSSEGERFVLREWTLEPDLHKYAVCQISGRKTALNIAPEQIIIIRIASNELRILTISWFARRRYVLTYLD